MRFICKTCAASLRNNNNNPNRFYGKAVINTLDKLLILPHSSIIIDSTKGMIGFDGEG